MEKNIYYCLLLLFFCFTGCSKNENSTDLNQTQWKGVLQYKVDNVDKECEISLIFKSEIVGEYIITSLEFEENEYSDRSIFFYTKDKNIILFNEGDYSIIEGYWWVYEQSNNRLVLKKEPYDDKNIWILTLKKYF